MGSVVEQLVPGGLEVGVRARGSSTSGAAGHQHANSVTRPDVSSASTWRRIGVRTRWGKVAHAQASIGINAAAGTGRTLLSLQEGGGFYSTVIAPFIMAAWPGKLQKNTCGPSPCSLLTGTLTEVVWPPPTMVVWATTRASSGLT